MNFIKTRQKSVFCGNGKIIIITKELSNFSRTTTSLQCGGNYQSANFEEIDTKLQEKINDRF